MDLSQGQHTTFNHIDYLEGRHILSEQEKDDLIRFMEGEVDKPSKVVLFEAKVLPWLLLLLFLAGVMSDLPERFLVALVIFISCGIFLGVMVYIIKDVRSFDDLNRYKKIISEKTVYKVPIVVVEAWRDASHRRKPAFHVMIQYEGEENFQDVCHISSELYQHLENKENLQLFAYYFENSKADRKYGGKYHVVIGR